MQIGNSPLWFFNSSMIITLPLLKHFHFIQAIPAVIIIFIRSKHEINMTNELFCANQDMYTPCKAYPLLHKMRLEVNDLVSRANLPDLMQISEHKQ